MLCGNSWAAFSMAEILYQNSLNGWKTMCFSARKTEKSPNFPDILAGNSNLI